MKTKEQQAVERGNDLLLPFEAGIDDVAALEFSLDAFRDAAKAKAWATNHGFKVEAVTSMRDGSPW